MPGSSHDGQLHVIMAGNGNPYAAATPERLPVIFHLCRESRLAKLATVLGSTPDVVRAELEELAAYSLVERDGDAFRPAFFVADRDDVARVLPEADRVGEQLADVLLQDWEVLERAYATMPLSARHPFPQVAFMLVGAKLLDIALLDALAEDGTLMPPAPARPSPDRPDARYYFWMVEGDYGQLGRYGQRIVALPHDGWELASFGEYVVAGQRNSARDALDERVRELSARMSVATVAARTGLPRAGREDVTIWQALAQRLARGLALVYLEEEAALRALHASLAGGRDRPASFPEFFCWFDHLAYGAAVDALTVAGVLEIPVTRFAAMLWCGSADHGAF